MILDHLRNAALYRPIDPLFALAFDYLERFDPQTPDGRYDLQGDDLSMRVQTYETAPPAGKRLESHRRYIDIQYLVSGREVIYYQPTSLLHDSTAYDAAKDVQFHQGPDDRPVYLEAGNFTVFWPHDGHRPGCLWTSSCTVRKVVAKIRVG